MEIRCPFCKQDPFHYVDVGVGYVPAAVNCCDLGCALYSGDKKAIKLAALKQSGSPRKQARYKRQLAALELE